MNKWGGREDKMGYLVHICKCDSPAVMLMFRQYCMKYGFDCAGLAKLMFWKNKDAIRTKWIRTARIQAIGEWKKVRQDPCVIGQKHKKMMNRPNKNYKNKKGIYVHSSWRLSKTDRKKFAQENFRNFDIGDEAASNVEVPIVVPIEYLLQAKAKQKVALEMQLNAIEFVLAKKQNRDPVYQPTDSILISGHSLVERRKRCANTPYTTNPNKTILDISTSRNYSSQGNSEVVWKVSQPRALPVRESDEATVFMEHRERTYH